MTNVIALNAPARRQPVQAQSGALIDVFSTHRRAQDDVFWLKENAELLNILECTGAQVGADVLAPLAGFYQNLPERLSFFPQYYRFLLSICLDMEDLGWAGGQAQNLCAWVAHEGLPEAELSDLQRAEARRLLARRGISLHCDDGLTERLHRFIDRSATFALPNKKAAYELTHIVFYLSEYGRCDPDLSAAALQSLRFAGVLAYLDQNADLLAEVCVALRYAGQVPPQSWENYATVTLTEFGVETGPDVDIADGYHTYFVTGWLARISGAAARPHAVTPGRVRFTERNAGQGPLRSMSAVLFEMSTARSCDWTQMRPVLEQSVGPHGYEILRDASLSIDDFDDFFEGFSRMRFAG